MREVACHRMPRDYLAHTEFGRLSQRAEYILDRTSLEDASDEQLGRLRALAMELATAARGTGSAENVLSAMQTFARIQREADQRDTKLDR